jgi:hypothetical protein
MPVDHVLIRVGVHQVDAEVAFLVGAFGHMGLKEFMRPIPSVVGLGDEQHPWLWVSGVDQDQKPFSDDDNSDALGIHLALSAKGMSPSNGPRYDHPREHRKPDPDELR